MPAERRRACRINCPIVNLTPIANGAGPRQPLTAVPGCSYFYGAKREKSRQQKQGRSLQSDRGSGQQERWCSLRRNGGSGQQEYSLQSDRGQHERVYSGPIIRRLHAAPLLSDSTTQLLTSRARALIPRLPNNSQTSRGPPRVNQPAAAPAGAVGCSCLLLQEQGWGSCRSGYIRIMEYTTVVGGGSASGGR